MKYEAVIFDLGGTLINQSTWEEQDNYVRRMAEVLGVPYDDFHRLWRATYEERTKGTFGSVSNGIKYICQQLHLSIEENKIESAARIPFEITKRMIISLKNDSLEVVSALKTQGLKTGLVCNWSEHMPAVWQDCPLAPLIDVAVFSSSEGVMKPDSRIFLLAADRLGVKPDKCLYIADGMDEELAGAARVGMTAIMIRYPDTIDSNPYRGKWNGSAVSSLREVLDLVI